MSKGDCFKVAAKLVTDNPDWVLCHGEVWHEETGRHWHAWCEETRLIDWPDIGPVEMVSVVDRSNGNNGYLPVGLYYKLGDIDEQHVRRYTFIEAVEQMMTSRHYGPWVEAGAR